MIDSIRWWLSLRRNANFWDWIRDTYSPDGLKALSVEATDASLINPYDPFNDRTLYQQQEEEYIRRKTVLRLMRRYGDEIWSICLGAGGYDPDHGPTGLKCLAGLELAFQVCDQITFDEFLVRNAIKYGARQVLGKRKEKT